MTTQAVNEMTIQTAIKIVKTTRRTAIENGNT